MASWRTYAKQAVGLDDFAGEGDESMAGDVSVRDGAGIIKGVNDDRFSEEEVAQVVKFRVDGDEIGGAGNEAFFLGEVALIDHRWQAVETNDGETAGEVAEERLLVEESSGGADDYGLIEFTDGGFDNRGVLDGGVDEFSHHAGDVGRFVTDRLCSLSISIVENLADGGADAFHFSVEVVEQVASGDEPAAVFLCFSERVSKSRACFFDALGVDFFFFESTGFLLDEFVDFLEFLFKQVFALEDGGEFFVDGTVAFGEPSLLMGEGFRVFGEACDFVAELGAAAEEFDAACLDVFQGCLRFGEIGGEGAVFCVEFVDAGVELVRFVLQGTGLLLGGFEL
jgi:hypothetical protein